MEDSLHERLRFLLLGIVALCACGDDSGDASVDGPQLGLACSNDAHCFAPPVSLLPTGPVEARPLTEHECASAAGEYDYCRCAYADGDVVYLSAAAGGDECLDHGRDRECLYPRSEFPGCDPGNPGSCEAVCTELEGRRERDAERTIAITPRGAYCREGDCRTVFEIEGRCFVGNSTEAYDCELSDEEIVERAVSTTDAGVSINAGPGTGMTTTPVER